MRTTTTKYLVLYMIALGGKSSIPIIRCVRGFSTAGGGFVTTKSSSSRQQRLLRLPLQPSSLPHNNLPRSAPNCCQTAARRCFVNLPTPATSRQRVALQVMPDSSSSATTATVITAPSSTTSTAPANVIPRTSGDDDDDITNAVETVMSDDDRYLFDLNGFVIVRGVLTMDEVRKANDAIDNHQQYMVERRDDGLRNANPGTYLYGTGTGRKDLGRMLEWTEGDSAVFQSILAHERLVPYFHVLLGPGYRMDHLPLVIAQDCGAEGFQLHGGTIDCHSGEYNHHLAYNCVHGTIRTHLLGCNVMLTDHNAGDGGFCVVPGSHKSQFKMPKGMVDGERYREYIIQPETKAGDVVLFSEGTVHGAMAWTPTDRQRRVCLYRFAPATMAYGRSYFTEGDGENAMPVGRWPAAMYEGLTDAQRAVLEPPYATRLDRPLIMDATTGTVQTSSRSKRKKQHDAQVFGTPYF